MLKQPFEVPFSEVEADPAPYIDVVFARSHFKTLYNGLNLR
jgi:hypothetical protein